MLAPPCWDAHHNPNLLDASPCWSDRCPALAGNSRPYRLHDAFSTKPACQIARGATPSDRTQSRVGLSSFSVRAACRPGPAHSHSYAPLTRLRCSRPAPLHEVPDPVDWQDETAGARL